TTASTHLLAYGLWPVLCPTTVLTVSPPSAQSPFAPCGREPHGGDAASIPSQNITPPSSLLRTHSPVAAASPLLRFSLVGGVFAGCHQSLLPAGPSRPYLRESFLGCWIPYPRRSHSVLLPVSSAVSSAFPTKGRVGFPRIVRLKRLRAGR